MINIANHIKPQYKGKNIYHNILFTICFALAVFLPDFVIKILFDLPIHLEFLFFGGVLLFGFLLSLAGNYATFFFLGIIFLMQTIQLNYLSYFGTPLEASNLVNIARETKDIFDLSYLRTTWFNTPLLLILYGLCVYVFKKCNMVKIKWIWIILLYLAMHKPYRAFSHTKDIWYFQPSVTRPSLRNSINTFSYFFFRYLPDASQTLNIAYKPYSAQVTTTSETENILLIFGESLYSQHIQLYGYNRQTFPRMEKRIKSNPEWQIASGLSGGIATATSTLLFFNGIREPANHNELQSKTANLFRLAKQAGYKTYYFSNQESRLTMSFGAKNVDKIITNDTKLIFFSKYHDEGLAKLLNEIDFTTGKHFVVLHMRSPHSPFENRYKGREEEFEKFKPAAESKDRFTYYQNTYDNALLYTDMAIDSMVAEFEKLNQGKNYSIYITADHGELINYNGMYGHNNLVIEQAKVPFFVKKKNNAALPPVVSHYQMVKMIAQDIGAVIHNPNEEDNTYYLHGNNIDFPYDFIKYKINDNGTVTETEKNNTSNLK